MSSPFSIIQIVYPFRTNPFSWHNGSWATISIGPDLSSPKPIQGMDGVTDGDLPLENWIQKLTFKAICKDHLPGHQGRCPGKYGDPFERALDSLLDQAD